MPVPGAALFSPGTASPGGSVCVVVQQLRSELRLIFAGCPRCPQHTSRLLLQQRERCVVGASRGAAG